MSLRRTAWPPLATSEERRLAANARRLQAIHFGRNVDEPSEQELRLAFDVMRRSGGARPTAWRRGQRQDLHSIGRGLLASADPESLV